MQNLHILQGYIKNFVIYSTLTRLNVSFKEANIDEKGAGVVGECSGENEDC